jgi:outer membrane lipoprotein-sorting protein
MNRFIAVFPGLLLTFITGLSQVQESFRPMKDPDLFREKLLTASASINSIASDFTQEKNLSVLSEKIISKGRFCFKKENNIRWEYTEPYKYLIIIADNKMLMRDEKTKKQMDMQSNPLFQQMNKFISGCIQGDILQDDNDFAKAYFENDRNYYVKLSPKADKMRQMINEVHIWFDKNDLSVTSLRMVESGNDYTQINFVNKILNAEISPEKFSFK